MTATTMRTLLPGTEPTNGLLHALFGESPIGIAFHDRELRFAYVNRTLAVIGGTDPAACIGRRCEEAWPHVAPLVVPDLERVLERREPVLGRRFAIEGQHWLASYSPICSPSGVLLGVGSVVLDETEHHLAQMILTESEARYRVFVAALEEERRLLEARVEERTATLARVNERLREEAAVRQSTARQLRMAERLASIGTFTAGVAHEINNPLAAIVAATEVARVIAAEGDPRRELDGILGRIVDETHRGGEIVKGLLRFAREEVMERWPIDPRDAVEGALVSAQGHHLAASCHIVFRASRRVPRVVMNPTELEHIVLNLVRNAVQAGAATVTVSVSPRPEGFRLRVLDDGSGIDGQYLDHIFDPFFTTRQRDGGTGLGLSIVHGIVAGYGGQIVVRSRLGRGSTVTVDIPVDAAIHTEAIETSARRDGETGRRGGLKIL